MSKAWLALAIWTPSLLAQTPGVSAKAPHAVEAADVVQWILALVLVLMLFLLTVWLMRRASGMPWLTARQPMQIVASLSLGVRERLVVVNIGEKQLVLGVTTNRIDKLTELEGEQRILLEADSKTPVSFAQQLQMVLNGRRHD